MKKLFTKKFLSAVLSLVFCVSMVTFIPVAAEDTLEAYFLDGTVATEATFILDPGHGGEDPGALGPADENGVSREEADDNLAMALKVAAALEAKGETVALTRITDKTVALIDRSHIANAGKYKIFCSLHRNSFSNPAATGTETYYYNELSADSAEAKIASIVHENLMKTSSSIVNRGVKSANFSVLRETETCAILIENLFISNPNDNVLFDQIIDDLANNIANGLYAAREYAIPDNMLAETYSAVDLGDTFEASILHIATGLVLTNLGNFDVAATEATYGANQVWTFEKTSSKNAYKLTSKLDGTCLDIASAGREDGTNVMVWEDNGGDCQRFYFYDVDGVYYIRPVHCKNGKVIDVSRSTNNAQLWNFGATNVQQQFALVKELPVEPPVEPKKLELKDESSYLLAESTVSNIKCDTTFEAFASNFKNEIQVSNLSGEAIENSALVGTGYVVSATYTDETATVIILGDVDGDGLLSATDYIRIKAYFLGNYDLESVYFAAADVDGTSEIDATDYIRLKSHFLKLTDIYA